MSWSQVRMQDRERARGRGQGRGRGREGEREKMGKRGWKGVRGRKGMREKVRDFRQIKRKERGERKQEHLHYAHQYTWQGTELLSWTPWAVCSSEWQIMVGSALSEEELQALTTVGIIQNYLKNWSPKQSPSVLCVVGWGWGCLVLVFAPYFRKEPSMGQKEIGPCWRSGVKIHELSQSMWGFLFPAEKWTLASDLCLTWWL